jgi:hypothetical protein
VKNSKISKEKWRNFKIKKFQKGISGFKNFKPKNQKISNWNNQYLLSIIMCRDIDIMSLLILDDFLQKYLATVRDCEFVLFRIGKFQITYVIFP